MNSWSSDKLSHEGRCNASGLVEQIAIGIFVEILDLSFCCSDAPFIPCSGFVFAVSLMRSLRGGVDGSGRGDDYNDMGGDDGDDYD